LTGNRLKAKDTLKWGIATHYVPQEQIENLRNDIIDNIN
jgi:hypothetical protein